jgi:hypothetical protein
MEVDGYPIREKKIALPKDGTIPSLPETVGREEQQALLAWISCLWPSVEVVSAVQQPRICCGPVPTRAEAFLGWKRWILGHHFVIPRLALVGHTLSTACKSIQAGERKMARKSLEPAARMRRRCGALFMHSVDFQPCSTICCRHIRYSPLRIPRSHKQ